MSGKIDFIPDPDVQIHRDLCTMYHEELISSIEMKKLEMKEWIETLYRKDLSRMEIEKIELQKKDKDKDFLVEKEKEIEKTENDTTTETSFFQTLTSLLLLLRSQECL